MTGFKTIAEWICQVMTMASMALLGILAFPIAFDATMRALGHPTLWVFEATLYIFIAAGFLGNALAMGSGAHFRVMLLAQLFPRIQPALDWLALLLTLLFAVLLIGAGSYYVWYSWSNAIVSATLLEVPLWIPELALPVGGLGLFLQTLIHIAEGRMPEGEYDAQE
jgi:C4-dicarboxylate transporter DctQ subunit